MKFKTVSEFIHALEVEGKKFNYPYDPHDKNYFVGWKNGNPRVIEKDTLASHDFHAWEKVLSHDWQEYQPEPETEEIELEEWMWKLVAEDLYVNGWVEKGCLHYKVNAFKTGVTRKVKVPK